jgi:hypothetical protein
MLARRKIQVAAALVIIGNGLFALAVPDVASANPCAEKLYGCYPGCIPLTACQAIANPGCTATGVVCQPEGLGCIAPQQRNSCLYQ